MEEERIAYFKSLTDTRKMRLTYKDFIKSEVLEIIDELLVKEEIKQEARLFFVDCLTIEQVSELTMRDKKTITRHKHKLSHALRKTIIKMYPYSKRTKRFKRRRI